MSMTAADAATAKRPTVTVTFHARLMDPPSPGPPGAMSPTAFATQRDAPRRAVTSSLCDVDRTIRSRNHRSQRAPSATPQARAPSGGSQSAGRLRVDRPSTAPLGVEARNASSGGSGVPVEQPVDPEGEPALAVDGPADDHGQGRHGPEVAADPQDGGADLLVGEGREGDPGTWA